MLKGLPARLPNDHRKQMESFATFWLPDGSTHRIRVFYIPAFMGEIVSGKRPLSPGAQIIKDAVKSRGAGRMCELLHMVIDDEPAPAKEQTFEELFNQLHDIPAPERGE